MVQYELEVTSHQINQYTTTSNSLTDAFTVMHNGSNIVFTNACPQANSAYVCTNVMMGFDNNGNPVVEGCGIDHGNGQQAGFDTNGNLIVEGGGIDQGNGQQPGFDNNGNPLPFNGIHTTPCSYLEVVDDVQHGVDQSGNFVTEGYHFPS